MRVPVVLLFTVLVNGVVESWLVSKCDLKTKLIEATDDLMKDRGLAEADVVAKIVCHVEKTSGFNTSAVTKVVPTSGPAQYPGSCFDDGCTLYGIFQLSNHMACSDGERSSPNLCNCTCTDLIDNNISDDIACLQKLYTELLENFFLKYGHPFRETMMQLFQSDCTMVKAEDYFAECK